jgi:DNA-directed RNA polymerase specialized sigma24 family protein
LAPARQKWDLTQHAFDCLLSSLGPNREAAADHYLQIRRNLVRLFEWRGCATPDEYADEAINRCAKKIGEGEEIRDLSSYSIGVARMLLREIGHDCLRETPLEAGPEPRIMPVEPQQDEDRRLECLRRCLGQLSADNRDLILSYYEGEKGAKIKNRKELEHRFGIGAGTLRMRALRLRETLQRCGERCSGRQQ